MTARKKADVDNGTQNGKQRTKQRNSRKEDFPVIGIGASAGGLEAFGKFFSTMPIDTGMTFVMIQHLDPTHTSNMVNLLKRQTQMPVAEATDGMKLEPNHVYMVPPNKNMTITDRTLRLEEQPERPGISHSIDLFFRSLATDLQEKAICIILSGTGNDGSRGARAVKAEMGMVMVQEPKTAGYDGMPMAAVDAGVADFVLPPEEMPEQLIQYIRKSYGKRRIRREQIKIQTGTLSNILSLVRSKTKHDFTGYKQSTINRRIERRMSINQIDDINQYLRYLSEHTGEVEALVKDFLINVTSFFRDKEAFSILKEYMKTYISRKTDGEEIRAWVTGCSTGEEAYSMAIVLEEAQEELGRFFRLQIFGTDLDQDAIEAARTGIYPPSIIADVSKERLDRFFIRKDDHFQIKRELREKLIFAVQDIIIDPPFTRMDLISARNLLIYFESELQRKLIPMFNYALNQGGVLFLGTAETVGEFTDGFEIIDRKWKMYREKTKTSESGFRFIEHPSWKEPPEATPKITFQAHHPHEPAEPSSENILLEALPTAVLIDRNYQVIYTHGKTGRFMELPEGKPNMNILDMVRIELRAVLTTGFKEALSKGEKIIRQGTRIKVNGSSIGVRMTITPVSGEAEGQLIITFEEGPVNSGRKSRELKDRQTVELEQELQFTKETLRSTIEELETANEELRSANEEYQSTNEELQSTNEELETSREELQSLNEELTTVNTEHQKKIEELSTINDDMNNLLNSTGVATIFLNEDLKLQRFTPAATMIFNLINSDVNRPISDITSQVRDHNITAQAQSVLDDLIPRSENVRTSDGKWYEMRINPYRTTENAISGVVVTFIDVTKRKQAEEEAVCAREELEDRIRDRTRELSESERRFRTLVTASTEVLYRMSPDWSEMRQLHSRGFLANTDQPIRNWLQEYIPEEEHSRVKAAFRKAIRNRSMFELKHRVRKMDGTIGLTLSRAVPMVNDDGEIVEWFGTAIDMTGHKRAKEK